LERDEPGGVGVVGDGYDGEADKFGKGDALGEVVEGGGGVGEPAAEGGLGDGGGGGEDG